MFRGTTILFSLVLASSSQAQLWCPPGAAWHYDDMSFGYIGYKHRVYVGDTVHLGLPAQRIHVTGLRITYPGWPQPDTTWIDHYRYTHLSDSIVYVPAQVDGTVQWDTLLRFDAVPGDRWFLPNHEIYCDESSVEGMLEVIDTGHVDVNGVSLRYWNYGSVNEIGQVFWNGAQYFERIGFLHGFVPPPSECAIIEVGELLKCYWDGELSFVNPWLPIGTTCDITLGAAEVIRRGPDLIYPNPGTDHFMLTLTPGAHLIRLFDATGREVLMARVNGPSAQVGTAQLPDGLYAIRIDDDSQVLRWVKQ